MIQRRLLSLLERYRTGRAAGIAGIARAAGRIAGVKIGHTAAAIAVRKQHGLRILIPGNRLAHDLADRADGQIDRAVIQHRLHLVALLIIEGARRAVNDDGITRLHTQRDIFHNCILIQRTGCIGRNTYAADGSRISGLIPVHVFVHQLADRTDRHIGGIQIAERMHFLSVHVEENALHTVDLHRNIRTKLCRSVI